MLHITRGGLEDLIRASRKPAQPRALPPPASGPPDLDQLRATVARHGSELLV